MNLPQVPEYFVAARPLTQALDTVHGLQSVIEKALEDHGRAAIAQCDFEKYYDPSPTFLITQRFIDTGIPASQAMCLLRFQMCRLVIICTSSIEIKLHSCTKGRVA